MNSRLLNRLASKFNRFYAISNCSQSLESKYSLYTLLGRAIVFWFFSGFKFSPTRAYLEANNLDPEKLYFLFAASSGDLWFIASVLPHMLSVIPQAVILTSKRNSELLRVFIGIESYEKHVIILSDNNIEAARRFIYRDILSQKTLCPSARHKTHGVIRSCHIACYPYLAELCMSGSLGYFECLTHVLSIPDLRAPSQPIHYSNNDYTIANRLVDLSSPTRRFLLNLVNFSHSTPSLSTMTAFITYLQSKGVDVYINSSLAASSNNCVIDSMSTNQYIKSLLLACPGTRAIDIPLHLMALIMCRFSAIIGADGGAMAIASGFTHVPCYILGTPSKFYGEYTQYRRDRNPNPYWDTFAFSMRGDNPSSIIYNFCKDLTYAHFDEIYRFCTLKR